MQKYKIENVVSLVVNAKEPGWFLGSWCMKDLKCVSISDVKDKIKFLMLLML